MATSDDLLRLREPLAALARAVFEAAAEKFAVGGWVAATLEARYPAGGGGPTAAVRVELPGGKVESVGLPAEAARALRELGEARPAGEDRWHGLRLRVGAAGQCETTFDYEPARSEDQPRSDMESKECGPLGEAEFEALLERAMAELRVKTEAHAGTWGLGKFARWGLEQDVGDLVFTDPTRGRAAAPAQIVGSWVRQDGTWLWAWANPSVTDALKRDALRVREFGERHGLEPLVQPKWAGTEQDAWRMAALAVHLCGAQGAYRGPAGPAFVFISFGEVRLSKPRPA